MDFRILKALFKLAQDILENPVGSSKVTLDESLFYRGDMN